MSVAAGGNISRRALLVVTAWVLVYAVASGGAADHRAKYAARRESRRGQVRAQLYAHPVVCFAKGNGIRELGFVPANRNEGEIGVPSLFAVGLRGQFAIADQVKGKVLVCQRQTKLTRVAWRTTRAFRSLVGVAFMPDNTLLICTGLQILRLPAGGGRPALVFAGAIGGPVVKFETYGSAWVQTDKAGAIYWIEGRRGQAVEGDLPRALVRRKGRSTESWPGVREFAVSPSGELFVVAGKDVRVPRGAIPVRSPASAGRVHLIGANSKGVHFTWAGGGGSGLGRMSGGKAVLWNVERDIEWPGERLVSDPEAGPGYWVVDYRVGLDDRLYALAVCHQRQKRYACILELSERHEVH